MSHIVWREAVERMQVVLAFILLLMSTVFGEVTTCMSDHVMMSGTLRSSSYDDGDDTPDTLSISGCRDSQR